MTASKGFIIYDSDCGFCQNSMVRLKKIIGDVIDYKPRAELNDGEYGISKTQSNGAIQFVDSSHQIYSGAHAIFQALSYKAGWGIWLQLYKQLPGFKLISDAVYKLVAKYRSQISRSCKI